MSDPQLYQLLKALHIIGWVSWMAGIFYLGRLQVYMSEASGQSEPNKTILQNQYTLMMKRVYGIILVPAMCIAWIFGIWMLVMNTALFSQGWMHVKLFILVLFTGYTHFAKSIMKKQIAGVSTLRPEKLRQLNEVPTLAMVSVIFLAIFKNGLNAGYGIVGFVVFALLLQMGIRYYRKVRKE